MKVGDLVLYRFRKEMEQNGYPPRGVGIVLREANVRHNKIQTWYCIHWSNGTHSNLTADDCEIIKKDKKNT